MNNTSNHAIRSGPQPAHNRNHDDRLERLNNLTVQMPRGLIGASFQAIAMHDAFRDVRSVKAMCFHSSLDRFPRATARIRQNEH